MSGIALQRCAARMGRRWVKGWQPVRPYLALLAAVILVWAHVTGAWAQDSRTTEVQQAARDWLAAADQLDGKTTYERAGTRFRQAITAAQWAEALRAAREPWGSVEQRALVSTRFETQFRDVPPGAYALLQYRTAYARKSDGHESLTLEREPDGAWRVIGYFIR